MSPAVAAILSLIPAAALVAAFLYFLATRHRREADADAVSKGGKRVLGLLLRDYWYWLHGPLEEVAERRGWTPDALTLAGLAVTFAAGLALAGGFFGLGGWLIVAGGALDILDGRIARKRGTSRPAGAFLDSSLDRYGDWALFSGLAIFFADGWGLWAALIALGGTFAVSYVRARAEALGIECRDGLVQRGERFFFLATVGILTPILWWMGAPYAVPMLAVVLVLAILSNVTAYARLRSVYRSLETSGTAVRSS